jgi:hypothetical protein
MCVPVSPRTLFYHPLKDCLLSQGMGQCKEQTRNHSLEQNKPDITASMNIKQKSLLSENKT